MGECNFQSTLTNITPDEVRFKKKPDIPRLCPFSCKAYVYNHSPKHKKLSPRAYEGIFIGYADTQKAYRIYIPNKRTVICTVHVRFDVNTNMANSFQAEGKIQFQYNSLKSSFQELDDSYDNDTTLEPTPLIASSDIIPEPALASVPNVPKHVPNVPTPQPDPPTHHPRQSRPLTPPQAPLSCIITATDRGDANRYKKAGQSNSVPFPTNNPDVVDVELNANSGGVPPVDEEEDNQELANIAHGEEPKTHKQAMASPDT